MSNAFTDLTPLDRLPELGSTPALPSVSVILPVYNEADFIATCVRSLQENTYPREHVEILVIDGGSTDQTRAIVADLAATDPRIRLIPNPRKILAAGINVGVGHARGDVLIRMDGHATATPTFIERSIAGLHAQPAAWCVGGPITTISTTFIGRVIAACMSSPVGVGNARFRTGNYEGFVDTVAFGAYRRKTFETVGLLDENLPRTEDDDLHFRLHEAGGRIYMTPTIQSNYYARSSLAKLWRQYYQYGYWRIPTMMKHGRPATLRQVVPLIFVVTWIVLLSGAWLWWPLAWALGAFAAVYGLGLLLGALGVARKHGAALALPALLVFPILHFSYGLGSLHGIWSFKLFGGRYVGNVRDAKITR